MTDTELRKLAHYIVQEQAASPQWMKAYCQQRGEDSKAKKLISVKSAAELLGVSPSWLYHHKDDEYGRPQFSYVKSGDSRSSTLKFNESTIMQEYDMLIAKRKKVVPIMRATM